LRGNDLFVDVDRCAHAVGANSRGWLDHAHTHLFNALTFATSSVLIAGVNLYALAIILQALLGWPLWVAVVISAFFVLVYITLGGLSGAIYNEVLQFFVILAGLIPIVIVGLARVGGWSGLKTAVSHTALGPNAFSTWKGTGIPWSNPLGDWIGIVFGLGFVLSFGYWTTNFAEFSGHSRRRTYRRDNVLL
jgi:SSS family solute:Na+ symporter